MIDERALKVLGVSDADVQKWLPHLVKTANRCGINTPMREAMFLAQIAHESGNFKFVVENLNYSANGLRSIFGKYFPNDEVANEYARQPERIANRVYSNRMGNNDEASGDGWKFRGRGLIQLTGKTNYTSFSVQESNQALSHPDRVAEPELACASAGWFWQANRLNEIADTGDVRAVTRRINGGFNGIEDRQTKFNKLIVILDQA